MKRLLYGRFAAIAFLSVASFTTVQSQVLYESVASGMWNDLNTWQRWSSGQVGEGIAETPVALPSGANRVLIHTGHTVQLDMNRSCRSVTVEAGGKLWAGSSTPTRLQVCSGGTGYPYPINDTIRIDGALGGPGDGVVIEPGANAANVTITGSGTIDVLRIRMPGGLAGNAANGGVLNMIFDTDINLYQHDNYALTAVYNPKTTDNYSITINPGRTVRLMDTSGYWHNNQYDPSLVFGNYTYNILGTLDLSINNQERRFKKFSASILAPQGINSHITLRIDGGVLKTGKVFIADTSVNTQFSLVSTGILKLVMKNGGQLDASAAQNVVIGYTSDGAGGYYPLEWGTSGRAFMQQTVADSLVVFPIGVESSNSGNRVALINSGMIDTFTVSIQDYFDHTPPAPLQVVNRQWNIAEAMAGGSNVTMRLSWVAADEASGVSHTPGSYFNIIHWNGSSWDYIPAIVTGAGTINDPYVAEATGITSFSPFGVINNFPVPVPVLFSGIKAIQKNGLVYVEFTNSTELNIKNYQVQRSVDGNNFVSIATIPAINNTGISSQYDCTDIPVSVNTVFYRIMATDKSGKTVYSSIIKLNNAGNTAGIFVYPVPVKGNQLSISLLHIAKGIYTISISNELGQTVHTEKINHTGDNATQVLTLPSALQQGIYNLQLNNSEVRMSKALIVQ